MRISLVSLLILISHAFTASASPQPVPIGPAVRCSVLLSGINLNETDLYWIESVARAVDFKRSRVNNDNVLSGIYIFTDYPDAKIAERWRKALKEKFLSLTGSKESLIPRPETLPLPKVFSEFVTITSEDAGGVVIRISTYPEAVKKAQKNGRLEFHNALMRLNMKLFQRTYRKSGLVAEDWRGGYALLGEWLETMEKANELPDSVMLRFDRATWNSIVQRIDAITKQFENDGKELSRINGKYLDENIFEPLFPSHGVSIFAKPGSGVVSKVELKRLFKNEDVDPLGLLSSEKPSSVDSLRFYLSILMELPEKTILVAEAHRSGLVAFYHQLGFKEVSVKTIKFDGQERQVIVLEQSRETLLDQVQKLLSKSVTSPE